MNNEKYEALREHLKQMLKTAKKLGLNVRQGGGYSMGYDVNNLPPYAVGLFGALSIVEGAGARGKLGLTFEETMSLEAGFEGHVLPKKSKKKKKKIYLELVKLGAELSLGLFRQKAVPRIKSAKQQIVGANDLWSGGGSAQTKIQAAIEYWLPNVAAPAAAPVAFAAADQWELANPVPWEDKWDVAVGNVVIEE